MEVKFSVSDHIEKIPKVAPHHVFYNVTGTLT